MILSVSISTVPSVNASPIRVPNLRQCELATDTSVSPPIITVQLNCCLPIPAKKVINFSFGAYPPRQKHVRRAAHLVSADYIAKYNRAYELMRSLPTDDPRSLFTQANIHCAFCNGAYRQAGNASVPLQVHFSWLFVVWHRWYLYFHERILGSLLGDPSFSLVFWNWDDQHEGGNVMPAMFLHPGTALYDENRNQANLPPTLVKLSPGTTGNDSVVVNANLNAMYQDTVTANSAELFLGGAYRTGVDLTNSTVLSNPLGGRLENGIHNAIHYWTGDPRQGPLRQDMGTFTTAARDPIFYAHHSNVDRLWDVWRTKLPGGPRANPSDSDFLNSAFYFYDETASLVKVTVRDALDNSKFGISYPDMATDNQWIFYDPPAISNGSAVAAARASGVPNIGRAPQNGTIAVGARLAGIVKAPTGQKPGNKQEVLVVQGLEVTRDSFVAVIVFVNLPAATNTTATSSAEYVGTFNIIPTASKNKRLKTDAKFEIGDNLKRIGIQNEPEVVITLAVRGTPPITIRGLWIKYE